MPLRAAHLSHAYGTNPVLRDISLEVAAGECVALVGASGSGKTTLLRCFNRLVEPDQGVVAVFDQDVRTTDPSLLRRRIGYVPQDGGLLPHWTVARNSSLVPWLLGDPDHATRATAALDLVGLDSASFGDRYPAELSGGQRQRVALARAIAAEPSAILLDEPFGALDAITRSELHELFRALRPALGMTTLLVTHDLHEAFLLADRVAVMHEGLIEQVGTPDQLMADPATRYVHSLLEHARVTS
jgi:osmoprotectant transport system ATP-binding protein